MKPEINVSSAVAIKKLSWANCGWHTRIIGPDNTRYTELSNSGYFKRGISNPMQSVEL
jgi:hypothetical protein